jgi:polyphosphate kinase 2
LKLGGKMATTTELEIVENTNGNFKNLIEPTENEDEVIVPKGTQITAQEIEALFTAADFKNVKSFRPLIKLLNSKGVSIRNAEKTLRYEDELEELQVELVKLQRWVQANKKRVAIIFEGRDAAGKGGTIRRFIEHLNPRAMRVVALPKPTEEETGQWYFQRYVRQLPNPGEVVFFDRSWYNRAVVEPVMGFCNEEQYERFMQQVTEFEHMLYEDGITVIKFWFSISKDEQQARFSSREVNPLKQWKLSPIDQEAQGMWDKYTTYKEKMFSRTHTTFSPWIIVRANDKKKARLESIRYVLSIMNYEGKEKSATTLYPDPNVITRFHRLARKID